MPLFGTFKDAAPGAVPELAPGGYAASDLESGTVVQNAANFGTQGGEVGYRWLIFPGIKFKPFVPDPYKPMYTRVRAFPPRVNKTRVTQLPALGLKTQPVSFTPPSTASILSFDEGDIY